MKHFTRDPSPGPKALLHGSEQVISSVTECLAALGRMCTWLRTQNFILDHFHLYNNYVTLGKAQVFEPQLTQL